MIGQRIKESRLKLGYSAEQVAAFLNVSPATVYRYENGDISKLPAKFILPLAEYLCVSPEYLMGWEDQPADDSLSADEVRLLSSYRILPAPGKQYIHQQLVAAQLMYGKKSEDLPRSSVTKGE